MSKKTIPKNFAEEGKVGDFKIKSLIEAAVIGFVIGFPIWKMEFIPTNPRIVMIVCLALIPAAVAAFGINNETFSGLIRDFVNYKKHARVYATPSAKDIRDYQKKQILKAKKLEKFEKKEISIAYKREKKSRKKGRRGRKHE